MAHVDLLDCVYIYMCVFFNNQDVDFVGENPDVMETPRDSNRRTAVNAGIIPSPRPYRPPFNESPRDFLRTNGIYNHIPKMHDENGAVV